MLTNFPEKSRRILYPTVHVRHAGDVDGCLGRVLISDISEQLSRVRDSYTFQLPSAKPVEVVQSNTLEDQAV